MYAGQMRQRYRLAYLRARGVLSWATEDERRQARVGGRSGDEGALSVASSTGANVSGAKSESDRQRHGRLNMNTRPRIVCLCGSTRFYREFQKANYDETMAGRIVLSVGFFMHSAQDAHGEQWGCTPEQKVALDVLHKQKIDLADEVLI